MSMGNVDEHAQTDHMHTQLSSQVEVKLTAYVLTRLDALSNLNTITAQLARHEDPLCPCWHALCAVAFCTMSKTGPASSICFQLPESCLCAFSCLLVEGSYPDKAQFARGAGRANGIADRGTQLV